VVQNLLVVVSNLNLSLIPKRINDKNNVPTLINQFRDGAMYFNEEVLK